MVNLIGLQAVELIVSEAVLGEYHEVFSRPKFAHIPPAQVATLLSIIQSEATLITPTHRLAICRHESDNRFYECADAAGADYIVTGNLKHFAKPYKNTKILTCRQFMELLARAGDQ